MRAPFAFIKRSGFNPLSVASGTAKVWYDLAFATNTGGGTPVLATLPDRSGNGCNGVIPVGNEPKFTAANAAFNNLPTMDFFTPADQRYVETGDIGIATNAPFTVVFVADSTATATATNPYVASSHLGQDIIYSAASAISGDSGGTNIFAADGPITSPSVCVAVFNGASSRYYISSKTPLTGDVGSQNIGTSPNRIMRFGMYGAAIATVWSQNGSTAHVLVYDGALNNADCGYLLDGFGSLAGITITP